MARETEGVLKDRNRKGGGRMSESDKAKVSLVQVSYICIVTHR